MSRSSKTHQPKANKGRHSARTRQESEDQKQEEQTEEVDMTANHGSLRTQKRRKHHREHCRAQRHRREQAQQQEEEREVEGEDHLREHGQQEAQPDNPGIAPGAFHVNRNGQVRRSRGAAGATTTPSDSDSNSDSVHLDPMPPPPTHNEAPGVLLEAELADDVGILREENDRLRQELHHRPVAHAEIAPHVVVANAEGGDEYDELKKRRRNLFITLGVAIGVLGLIAALAVTLSRRNNNSKEDRIPEQPSLAPASTSPSLSTVKPTPSEGPAVPPTAKSPTPSPAVDPASPPSSNPTTSEAASTTHPTSHPTQSSTEESTLPSSLNPSESSTQSPTTFSAEPPTEINSFTPSTSGPTRISTPLPTSDLPTMSPTESPVSTASYNPTLPPVTDRPTQIPTMGPTPTPSGKPSAPPTRLSTPTPSEKPTPPPTRLPTPTPSEKPTAPPTKLPTSLPDSQVSATGLLVLLYSWPTIALDDSTGEYQCISEHWKTVATSVAADRTIAVVNPNNGPQHGGDTWKKLSYDTCIAYIKKNNVEVSGYVHTKLGYPDELYAYRDINEVKADIDMWSNEYNVDGIFIDEVSNRWLASWDSLEKVISFNHDIVDYVLNDKLYGRAILDPGSPYFEDIMKPFYGNTKVIAVLFEGKQWGYQRENCISGLWTQAQGSFTPGPWCNSVPNLDGIEPLKAAIDNGWILPEQSAVLIYGAESTAAATETSIDVGVAANVGWFYIVDNEDEWSAMPSDLVMATQAAKVL